MPPILALTLCTIFVLFLLRLDRKQYSEASLALWVPTIWFLLSTSKALGVWFGTAGTNMEEGSALDRNVLILLLLLGFFIIKKRKVDIFGSLRQNPSVFLLIGFMLISITWSDMHFISFKRWVRNLIPIVMVLIIASEDDPRQALQSLFRRMIYVHIPFSLMLIKYYPHLGREYLSWSGEVMWLGTSTQKNGLAFLCAFSIFYFAWTFIRRRQGRNNPVVWYQAYIEILIVFLSIWIFIGPNRTLTHSAASLVALIVGLISLIGLLYLKKHDIIMSVNALTIITLAIIIYGTVTPFIGGLTLFDPSTALNRSGNLTGRTEIWAFLVPYARQKLILGHGYGGFWTSDIREMASLSAHNGYLNTILNTGFIGLFFLSLFLISNCRKAGELMLRDFDWGFLWLCILLMAVTHNIVENSISSLAGFMPSVLLFFLISTRSKNVKQFELPKKGSSSQSKK